MTAITVKQQKPKQEALTGDPRFFVPPYVGRHGWVGIYAEEVEWDFVTDLVEQAYRLASEHPLSACNTYSRASRSRLLVRVFNKVSPLLMVPR